MKQLTKQDVQNAVFNQQLDYWKNRAQQLELMVNVFVPTEDHKPKTHYTMYKTRRIKGNPFIADLVRWDFKKIESLARKLQIAQDALEHTQSMIHNFEQFESVYNRNELALKAIEED